MAEQIDVLKALAPREGATKAEDLAKEIKTTDNNTRALLSKLKRKNLVDGDTKEGWYITDAGKEVVAKNLQVPVTLKDSGKDELSKFKYYGQVAGAEPDDIAAAAELFQSTNMRDIKEVERCLAEAAVPTNYRIRWVNLYRNYLRDTTPPADRDQLYPLPRAEEVRTRSEAGAPGRQEAGAEESLDFIVEGTEIRRTEAGFGDFTFNQALRVVAAKRGSVPRGSTESDLTGALNAFAAALKNTNPNQPLTVKDLLDFADKLKEARESGGGSGNTNQAAGYIDDEGWHPVQPGQPIVIKKEIQASPGKTVVVTQTSKGIEKREYQPGEPIIIETGAPPGGNNPMAMMPFPVFGSDGAPVTDGQGRPVYANIEPMLRWMGFTREEQRKDERHQALMGLAQTVRENVSDGIAALREAAQEVRTQRQAGGTKQEAGAPAQQVYECGECKTQFRLPDNPNWAQLQCPGCGHKWTREEVMKP